MSSPVNDSEQTVKPDQVVWGSEKPRIIDEDMLSYLQSVSGAIDNPEGEEEVRLLIANVFEEIENKEASVASHKKASLVLEKLIKRASAKQLETVLTNFSRYFGFLCFNRFTSHVVESVFTRAGHLFHQIDFDLKTSSDLSEDDHEAISNIMVMIVGLSTFLRDTEEWWNLSTVNTSTHIMRTLLHTLSGAKPISNKSKKRQRSAQSNNDRPPTHSGMFGGPNVMEKKKDKRDEVTLKTFPEFSHELEQYLVTVDALSLKDLDDLAKNTYGSPVLQKLLQCCSPKATRWVNIASKLVPSKPEYQEGEVEESTSNKWADKDRVKQAVRLVKDRMGSHLVEVIMQRAAKRVYGSMLVNFVLPRILDLARDKFANYPLQHCIEGIRKAEQLEKIADQFCPEAVAELLTIGHAGVLVKLVSTSLKFPEVQKKICKAILKGCAEWQKNQKEGESSSRGTVEALLQISADKQEDSNEGDKDKHVPVCVSIVGAQLVGSLLALDPKCNRPVFESCLALSEKQLYRLCIDPIGGRHVIEVLLAAPLEASWAIQRLVSKLMDRMVDLAENRFGHHVVRKCFDASTPKNKLAVVRLLSAADKRLKGSAPGVSTLQHTKVEQFQRHPDNWKEASEQATRKRRKMDQWLSELS